jgi:hypothetical protein
VSLQPHFSYGMIKKYEIYVLILGSLCISVVNWRTTEATNCADDDIHQHSLAYLKGQDPCLDSGQQCIINFRLCLKRDWIPLACACSIYLTSIFCEEKFWRCLKYLFHNSAISDLSDPFSVSPVLKYFTVIMQLMTANFAVNVIMTVTSCQHGSTVVIDIWKVL